MALEKLTSIVQRITSQLARGEFDRSLAECSGSRLTARDLGQVMQDYGRTFVEPPADAYADLDAVVVRNASLPTWSVRAPLWSKEEGRSDLAIELTVIQDGEHWNIELDDLHVL